MAAFLYNGERKYSYEVLINTINQHQEYFPLYKAPDLFSYFVNLIKAVVTNSPLVLLDSDLNLSEVPGIEESMVNKPTKLLFCQRSDSQHLKLLFSLQELPVSLRKSFIRSIP